MSAPILNARVQSVLNSQFLKAPLNGEGLQRMHHLVMEGAEINARTDNGNTKLLMATYNNFTDGVKWLIENGADVNLCDGNRSPLLVACQQNHHESAEILLAHGADVNLFDPLKSCFGKATHECIKTLIKAGADTSFIDHDGRTYIIKLARRGEGFHFEDGAKYYRSKFKSNESIQTWIDERMHDEAILVKKMIDSGVDIRHVDNNGFDAACYAANYKQSKILKVLLDHLSDQVSRIELDYLMTSALDNDHKPSILVLEEAMLNLTARETINTAVSVVDDTEVKKRVRL